MKVIRIGHIRCGEREKGDYYSVPDEMSGLDVRDAINKAEADYIDLYKKYDEALKLVPPRPSSMIMDKSLDPDWTIAYVRNLIEKYEELHAQAEGQRRAVTGSFQKSLAKYGIKPLYEQELDEHDVDWGHNHGKKFVY